MDQDSIGLLMLAPASRKEPVLADCGPVTQDAAFEDRPEATLRQLDEAL